MSTRSEYRKMMHAYKKLYKQLSIHAGIYNKYRDLKMLVTDIIHRDMLDIDIPDNNLDAVITASLILNTESLREITYKYRVRSVEDVMESYIKECGFNYERDAHIRRYVVDFILPDYDIVIEIIGKPVIDYIKDCNRVTMITRKGYGLYRFSTDMVIRNKKQIMKYLNELKQ